MHLKDQARVFTIARQYAAHSRDGFKLLLHQQGVRLAVAAGNLQQQRFGVARPRLQIAHGIGRHQLAFVDDQHLLAGLFHLGKNMGAENDGVVAGQPLDQVAGFINLLGIEAGGGLIEDQHIRVVNNGLRQPHSLAIAFGEFAQQLVFHIRHKAAVAHIVDALFQFRAGQALQLAHEAQIFDRLHFKIERRGFGQISDSLFYLEGLLENIESRD